MSEARNNSDEGFDHTPGPRCTENPLRVQRRQQLSSLATQGTQLFPGSLLLQGNLVPPTPSPGQVAAGRKQEEGLGWGESPLLPKPLPVPWGKSEPEGLGRRISRRTCSLGPLASSSTPGASAGQARECTQVHACASTCVFTHGYLSRIRFLSNLDIGCIPRCLCRGLRAPSWLLLPHPPASSQSPAAPHGWLTVALPVRTEILGSVKD